MGLTRRNFGRELLAGVTLMAIAVPLNIGYAQIAGLPPTVGLYAMIVPAIAYVFLVSSRQVVAAPDAAAAALVASSLGGLAIAGSADYVVLAFAQAIICGVAFLACGVLKLGFLANFLSKPILIGFVGGLALDILVGQLAKMLGVKINSGGEFLEKVRELALGLPTLNGWAILISVLSLAILLVGRRFAPIAPWALVVLVGATIFVVTADLAARGVSVLGEIEGGLPQLTWPILPWSTWLALVPSALALALVGMAEALLIARTYAERNGYSTNPNRDLLAFGVGNIAAGVAGGFTLGSSTSRTAAMDQVGSRTQLPSIVAALGTLALLAFGAGLLASIPSPAIGAIVALAVVPLLGLREFRDLWKASRFEFAIAVVCFLGTLLLGPIIGLGIAFVVSLVNLARRAANPPIAVLTSTDDLVVLRFAGPLFFANSAGFASAIRTAVESPNGRIHDLVLDLEAVSDIDVTAAEGFESTRSWLDENHVTLSFTRLREDLRLRLAHFGLLDGITVYETNRDAVSALSKPGTGQSE
jgi:high affinity sulfate transporter 1